ncbi:diacylglycerol kinase [Desulfovibrio sp. OttesenSCG-928-G15]|nr:diacylglycerol kinase [Desulfovibrio sp. OttesenSCG-928-G15]
MIGKHLRHVFGALGYSLDGLKEAVRTESAFQEELAALAAIALISFLLFPPGYCLALCAAWLFVMALELLNMGIESLADLVTKEIHPLVKRAKDAASAAILVGICANALLWAGALYQCYLQ